MSRIAKKPINIPEKVTVAVGGQEIKIKGPLGEMQIPLLPDFEVRVDGQLLSVRPLVLNKKTKPLWGTLAAKLKNALKGVTEGFSKQLEVEGIGYRVALENNRLVLNIGYSHPVFIDIPPELKVSTEKNTITVYGIDKEKVGSFAAYLRKQRPPNVYKGYGIRYSDEKLRRKPTKKLVSAG